MRWLILIISLLAILPSAYAEVNINILGKEYPLLLVAPIVLIILFGIFFIVNYLKENISTLKGLKLDFLRFKGRKYQGKKEERLITRNYLAEIIKLEKDADNISVEQALDKFDNITKGFFSDAYGIDYKFTYSELQQELAKRRINIDSFISKIDEVRYSGNEITNKDVQILTGELHYIVRNYYEKRRLQVIKEKEKTNLFSFIGDRLNAIRLKKIHKSIINKIEAGKQNIPVDLDSSVKDYLSATLDYYKLPERKNEELYKEVQKLHEGLRKAKYPNKEVIKLAKDLTNLKHKNKQVSIEGINLINKLKKALKKPLIATEKLIETEENILGHNIKDIRYDIKKFDRRFKNVLVKDWGNLKEDEHKIAKLIENDAERVGDRLKYDIKKVGKEYRNYNEKLDSKLLEGIEKLARLNKKTGLNGQKLSNEKTIKITPPKLSLKSLKLKLPGEPRIYQPKAIRQLEHEKNLIYKRLQNIEKDFSKDKFN